LATYPQAGPDQLQVVEITDIVDGDLSSACKDVHALVHVASPLFSAGDADYIIKTAIKGTENVLGQAIRAGIKKIVLTSSWASLFEPDMIKAFKPNLVDETWWSGVKLEDATSQKRDHNWAYMASKPLAEKVAWDLVEQNSDVDLTCILPPVLYGPFVPNYPHPSDRSKLGSNEWIYHLITGGPDGKKTYPRMSIAHCASIQDVAKAHVTALEVGPLVNEDGTKRKKRLITVAGKPTWLEIIEYLQEVRPELKERMQKEEGGPRFYSCCTVDMKLTKEVVGMGQEDMVPWKEFVLQAVDAVLEWERSVLK